MAMSLLAHSFELINSLPLDIPNPPPAPPPGFEGPVGSILAWVKWVALIVAVLGVIVIGGKMAINVRRGEAAGELGGLLYVGVGCILIGTAVSLVGFISGS